MNVPVACLYPFISLFLRICIITKRVMRGFFTNPGDPSCGRKGSPTAIESHYTTAR
jgi:hypothetical protein